MYGVQCTIVCCGVSVAYVACLEADTSSGWRLAVPLERLAAGWGLAVPPVGLSGWGLAAGGPTRRLERLGAGGWLGVPLERPAGGPARASGWRSRPCGAESSSGGRGWQSGGFGKSSPTPLINETFQNPPFVLPDPTN